MSGSLYDTKPMVPDIDHITIMEILYRDGRDLDIEVMCQSIICVPVADRDCVYETCTDLASESADKIRCTADMIEMTMCQQHQIQLPVGA